MTLLTSWLRKIGIFTFCGSSERNVSPSNATFDVIGCDLRLAELEAREAEALADRVLGRRRAAGDERVVLAVDLEEPREQALAQLAAALLREVDVERDDRVLDQLAGERLGRRDLEAADAEVLDVLALVVADGQARRLRAAARLVDHAAGTALALVLGAVAGRRRELAGHRRARAAAAARLLGGRAEVRVVGARERDPRRRRRAPRDRARS